MGIVKQYDKRSGITYVYESKAYWDKATHNSKATRKLIGRLDPETGDIIPTDGRNKKVVEPQEPDYKKLYEKAQKKCIAQEALIKSLKKELKKYKG